MHAFGASRSPLEIVSGSNVIKSVSAFPPVFEHFRRAVAARGRSDGPFTSFATGLPYLEESCKEWVYHQARHLLLPQTSKEKTSGAKGCSNA
jgi:hypothetical protein